MTRKEAYAEGFAKGCRWAETDIRNGTTLSWPAEFRENARTTADGGLRAHYLGAARGYRDTFARYDAGTLTQEMFDLAPRSPA